MLSYYGIKLHDLHLVRHVALIFCRGIEMASLCRRYQFNFISHVSTPQSGKSNHLLDFFASASNVAQDLVNAQFVDDSHSFRRDF